MMKIAKLSLLIPQAFIHKLGNYLNKEAYFSIDDVDIILFVVDGSVSIGPGDKFVIEKLKSVQKDVILVINKIDKMTNEYIMKKKI